jgi:ubiquinone/menaquinone biosynthesis C-methylase UbiE
MYHEMVGDKGKVHGLDISENNLKRIRESIPQNGNILLHQGYMEDILHKLISLSGYFDWVTCTYGLYYSTWPFRTIEDFKKLLKPEGHLCIINPARDNNIEFYEMVNSISEVPQSIINTSTVWMDAFVIPFCINLFKEFDVYEFNNEVTYPDPESLLSYWRSTTYYNPDITPKLEVLIKDHFDKNGSYKLTKQALGVKCWD